MARLARLGRLARSNVRMAAAGWHARSRGEHVRTHGHTAAPIGTARRALCENDRVIEIDRASVVEGDAILLAPVTASVAQGHALVVRGENGAGKSTLLRLLAGTMSPSAGAVTIAGDPVNPRDAAFRRSVAALIGAPPLARDLTLAEHLDLVATTWTSPPRDASRHSTDVLAALGLTSLAARFPHELSSGQTQLFLLALVLVRPSDVLVLDEPEQRLDADRLGTVIDVLCARRDEGKTLVIATHSETVAAGVADHSLWLDSEASA